MLYWFGVFGSQTNDDIIHPAKSAPHPAPAPTSISAALNAGGPAAMLMQMIPVISAWKEGPKSGKAVAAMRARPRATPAWGCVGGNLGCFLSWFFGLVERWGC
jgi:hypothetical protein